MLCTRCGKREAFGTDGEPVHISIEGERVRTITEPHCHDCLGEIYRAEAAKRRGKRRGHGKERTKR